MAATSIRLGVDIGGTFTDVVLEKGTEVFSTKVLTTYAAPENAIIDGMHQVCAKAGVDPIDVVHIIHFTTLSTSAFFFRLVCLSRRVFLLLFLPACLSAVLLLSFCLLACLFYTFCLSACLSASFCLSACPSIYCCLSICPPV